MTGLDLMTERELLARLHQLADECESLDRRIAHARQRQRFNTNPREAAEALDEEKRLLVEMSWLMDRRRAVEGHLLRVRGRLRPLEP